MEFIAKNYIIIIIIGLFIVFSLIGFLVEQIKNNKNEIKEEYHPENKEYNIDEIDINKVYKNKESNKQSNEDIIQDKEINDNIMNNSGDDLLENYDNNIE